MLIVLLPLAWRGASCGHDYDFHLDSWLTCLDQWREGVMYPHWMAAANYGAGEPRFIFYPPLTWMTGALLGLLLPWGWTSLAFTLLALMAAVHSFDRMAREWMSEDAATVAACCYIANPYLLFAAYERTVYGELASAALLPLVVLYGLRERRAMAPLALTLGALWLTNAPSALMASYLLAALVLIALLQQREWRLAVRAAGAVVLGLALAGIYLVPAIYEQRWVQIMRAIGPDMRVEDGFLFGYTADPFHNQVLRTASWIAVSLIAVSLIAAVTAALRNRREAQRLGLPLAGVSLLIALLLLPFSDSAWHLLPRMEYLQFPWRWLLVLGLTSAALTGLGLGGSFRDATTRRAIGIRSVTVLAFTVGMATLAGSLFWQRCDEEDSPAAHRISVHTTGVEGTDEYTPIGADKSLLAPGLPLVQGAAVSSVLLNQPQHLLLNLYAPSAGTVILRRMGYPAWHLLVNGRRATTLARRDGLIAVTVPAGPSQLELSYRTTPDLWLGRALTLLGLLLWVLSLHFVRL